MYIYIYTHLWSIFKCTKLYILVQDSSLMMATSGWNHLLGIFDWGLLELMESSLT